VRDGGSAHQTPSFFEAPSRVAKCSCERAKRGSGS
jgi:hypothetical protein